jgi:anti-anti-sigma factor
MQREHRHIPLDPTGAEPGRRRRHRYAPSLAPRLLTCCSAPDAVDGGRRLSPPGELRCRRVWDGDGLVLWLSGELDRSTCALLERELHAAQPDRPMLTVVDLTGLEFIDSHGLAALATAQERAGADGDLLLLRGCRIVEDLLACTSGKPSSDEDYYFALAMACAHVDHPTPVIGRRDPPPGFPGPAAVASGASLLGVARTARGACRSTRPPHQRPA